MVMVRCEGPGCGRTFEAARRTRRYCSNACKKRAARRPRITAVPGTQVLAGDPVDEALAGLPGGHVMRATVRALVALQLSQDELPYPVALTCIELARQFDLGPSAAIAAELRRSLESLAEQSLVRPGKAPARGAVASARAELLRRALGGEVA
jgi:hypothetical protein